jgi:hypothetical protein
MMRRVLAMFAGGFLLACAPRTEPADTVALAPSGGETMLRGEVQIVGSAPVNVQVVLQRERGGAVRLIGPLAEELANLSGALVEVRGEVATSPDPLVDQQVSVTRYDVVSVNGRPVVLGEIIDVTGDRALLRTAGGEEIHVVGVPGGFRVGQKVWVQGPQSVLMQSYGTIRP